MPRVLRGLPSVGKERQGLRCLVRGKAVNPLSYPFADSVVEGVDEPLAHVGRDSASVCHVLATSVAKRENLRNGRPALAQRGDASGPRDPGGGPDPYAASADVELRSVPRGVT